MNDAPLSQPSVPADPREPTSEAVERVERALARFVEGSLGRAGEPPRWRIHDTFDDGLPVVAWFTDRAERDAALKTMNARAAIAALREPTEAMVKAGNHEIEPDERLFYKHIAGDVWSVMIAAALADDQR